MSFSGFWLSSFPGGLISLKDVKKVISFMFLQVFTCIKDAMKSSEILMSYIKNLKHNVHSSIKYLQVFKNIL